MTNADILVAEIGSTTTVINAFAGLQGDHPKFLGQGTAPTTVLDGDVTLGLRAAIRDLELQLHSSLQWGEMLATSSAAGGLRMSVHGLVYDMTVRAAREAALGAGAILRMITAGELTESELASLKELDPNIILLAGGVDYGEKATVLKNARQLAKTRLSAPVIYAGNSAAADEAEQILKAAGIRCFMVSNVYPRIDDLDVEPARKIIQQVFEEHIVHAPGMDQIRALVTGGIMPTPGAVMAAARLLYESLGDILVLDVGGATTDVHSVTPGADEINRLLISPEPLAKRTVEGDLGVYINARNVAERIGLPLLRRMIGSDAEEMLKHWQPIPQSEAEFRLLEALTKEAVQAALDRHAGQIRQLYGPSGRVSLAEGKDLTCVRYVIGTGGPLTRLQAAPRILRDVLERPTGQALLPKATAEVLIDRDYNLAVLGVLGARYPQAAKHLMLRSLGLL